MLSGWMWFGMERANVTLCHSKKWKIILDDKTLLFCTINTGNSMTDIYPTWIKIQCMCVCVYLSKLANICLSICGCVVFLGWCFSKEFMHDDNFYFDCVRISVNNGNVWVSFCACIRACMSLNLFFCLGVCTLCDLEFCKRILCKLFT